jgi:phosphate transport system substrate-binding protein
MNRHTVQRGLAAAAIVAAVSGFGCSPRPERAPVKKSEAPDAGAPKKPLVRMASAASAGPLAQGWAEARLEIDGQALGEVASAPLEEAAIAAFVEGHADLALVTRKLDERELRSVRIKDQGKEPRDFVAGFEAVCLYVNAANPLEQISLEELAQIYGAKGRVERWADLKVKVPGARGGKLVRLQAQADTALGQQFRQAVLGAKGTDKPGALEANGAGDALALVAATPGAIGYAACGSGDERVKTVRVSRTRGTPGVAATAAAMADGSYPLARPLLLHMSGAAPDHVKRHLDWVLSEDGQRVVERLGYVRIASR